MSTPMGATVLLVDDDPDFVDMHRAVPAEKGYRVTVNVNPDGGQLIFHLHMHVFGGRKLTDAMG